MTVAHKIVECLKHPVNIILFLSNRGFGWFFPDEFYLKCLFKDRLGKKPDLKKPQTFNEKLQWLKLYDRRPEYTTMVDKYEVKNYITERIGGEYVIPAFGVWERFDDIDFDALPDQFVLKCTHDSGGLVICRDKSTFDRKAARKKISRSLKRNYYWYGREWPYKTVKPRILAEQYMEEAAAASGVENDYDISCEQLQRREGLLDYKFMCFNGKVRACFLDIGVIGKGTDHAVEYYRNIYDRNGSPLPFKETREHYPQNIILPEQYPEMVRIAEILSAGIPHLRVDLYLVEQKIKVGELTFFHGSGISNNFEPEEWDEIFGSWLTLPENKCCGN